MSASKKPARARRAKPAAPEELPSLGKVLHDLMELRTYLETAYMGVARNYYCYEVGMLRAGLTSYSNVLLDLERIEIRFSSSRGSNRISQLGKGGES